MHLIMMLIAGELPRATRSRSSRRSARLVREQELVDSFVHAPDLDTLYQRLLGRLRRDEADPGAAEPG